MAATEQEHQTAAVAGPLDGEGESRHFRRNVALVIAETVCFSLGIAFFDSGTIIPGFITSLTGSAVLLGLAPTLFQLGAGLPQLAAAGFVARRPRKMPFLVGASVARNLPFFALAAVAWSRPAPGALLTLFFLCYLAFALGLGAESVAWMDIFAKVCPTRRRGRVLATGRTIGNLLAIGAGFFISRVLSGGAFPRNYALLFLIGGLFMTAALLVFMNIREPLERVGEGRGATGEERGARSEERTGALAPPPSERAILSQGRGVWRADPNYRRYLAARFAYAASIVAVPFYFRFAREVVGIDDAAIGRFVSASMGGQIAANLLWGYVGDRFGSKRVVQALLLVGLLLPLYVLATPALPHGAFLLVYVGSGAILAGEMLGWMPLLLALAPAERRPLYVSLQGTLLTPANLLPLLAGLALSVVPYAVFFALIALAFALSLWLISRVRETPPAPAPGRAEPIESPAAGG